MYVLANLFHYGIFTSGSKVVFVSVVYCVICRKDRPDDEDMRNYSDVEGIITLNIIKGKYNAGNAFQLNLQKFVC